MADKPIRHRYPIWLGWPPEIAAAAIVVPTLWNYLQVGLAALFQLWPQSLENLSALPTAYAIVRPLAAASLTDPWMALLELNARAFGLFFLAAWIRNAWPQLRLHEKGLQVRRGFGWVRIPWERITRVHSMILPGERLVMLIQGRHWHLGPWFRLYSLLWGAGLRKGLVVNWHISDMETLADALATRLQEVYGEDLPLVLNDKAYSFFYALLFLPGPTWASLLAPKEIEEYTYLHPRWVSVLTQATSVALVVLGLWRYIAVWWRFLTNRSESLQQALHWPFLGLLLSTFGPRDAGLDLPHAYGGLLAAQVSMILLLVAVTLVRNLYPDWMLSTEGPAVQFRNRWLDIPWTAIIAIRKTLFTDGKGVVLVQVRWPRLTFWHSLYSLIYGAGLQRGVLFTSLLPKFQELLEHVEVGVVRACEAAEKQPPRPILVENSQAEYIQMLREPRATLHRWAQPEEEEKQDHRTGGLLKRAGYVPPGSEDLPWGTTPEETVRPRDREKDSKRDRGRAIRAALTLMIFPILLIAAEELLFPTLSRPLAWFALTPVPIEENPLRFVLLVLVMGLFVLLEWPFMAYLTATIAETYEQPGNFQRALLLYPRVLSPLRVLGLALLAVAATGILQPLYLVWWGGSLIWGAVLLWLWGSEMYGWRGLGNIFLVTGHVLLQALALLVYFLLR